MYLEYLKKLQAHKKLLEKSLLKDGSYPSKEYVNTLLEDMDMRLAILDYEDVKADTTFDTDKFNDDLYRIWLDLQVLYQIAEEIASEKYVELESYINGYLLALEDEADKADKRTNYELEATSLGADIVYFSDVAPNIQYQDRSAIINIGSLSFEALSRILCYIRGTGFAQNKVAFCFDDKRISPYEVNREYIKNGGTAKKNEYVHMLIGDEATAGAFKIADQRITANTDYIYRIYGGADSIRYISNAHSGLTTATKDTTIAAEEDTSYSFYLLDATYLHFDFSQAPTSKNFTDYLIDNLDKNAENYYTFKLGMGGAFSLDTDGTIYATKETPSIHKTDLYIASVTQAQDFLIQEFIPGDKVTYDDVHIIIYDTNESGLHIDSICIKEISDMEGGQE